MAMLSGKKFIAPASWFSIVYPQQWNEFEDSASTFLFYNPNTWNGNFRVSAYRNTKKQNDSSFGRDAVLLELKENDAAVGIHIGAYSCAYSKEIFQEEGVFYTNHHWVVDGGHIAIECTFTVPKGGAIDEAKQIIESIVVYEEGQKHPAEVIPARLSEISMIDEAYEWVVTHVKQLLKKDFQGVEDDIAKLQTLVDSGKITPKQRENWLAVGIALCVILNNEIEGFEWQTLIDGNREFPVLIYKDQPSFIDPMKLTWSKVKAGESLNLLQVYQEIIESL